jgi:RpiB/LacA/LacB family sugar-phosphate isomerase
MIRQTGVHLGKSIVFAGDRHLVAERDAYLDYLRQLGPVLTMDVHHGVPHYLAAAIWVSRRVLGRPGCVGILVCSTGIGVSIAANKFHGIYAARCLTIADAEQSRTVNNANVLCLASSVALQTNLQIVTTFLSHPYEGRCFEQLETIATFGVDLPVTVQGI